MNTLNQALNTTGIPPKSVSMSPCCHCCKRDGCYGKGKMKTTDMKTLDAPDSIKKMSASSSNSKILFNILREDYLDPDALAPLRDEFLAQGYVKLPGLLSSAAFKVLEGEVNEMRSTAVDRSFTMPGAETPRELSTVGGSMIASKFPKWLGLYSHHEIVNLVATLTGGSIYACQHEDEFMVANFLNRRRGTHGWHLDDPAYALILFFDAPPEGQGGSLEFVPDWHNFCERHDVDPEKNVAPLAEVARAEGLIQTRHHLRGDAYLLRADKSLHRVTELQCDGIRRAAINMAYQHVPFQVYGESATALYAHSVIIAEGHNYVASTSRLILLSI